MDRMTTGRQQEAIGAADESWMAQAECQGQDPELFHSTVGGHVGAARIKAAKAICARCPVRDACLDYALTTRQDDGVWGGTSARARRGMRRAARQVAR